MFAAFGCFSLPLIQGPLIPALLALAFWPAIWTGRGRRSPVFLAVTAGWLAAWGWRGDFASPAGLADLAVVGPALAMGALAFPARDLQRYLLLGGLVCAAAAIIQAVWGQATPLHWTGPGWVWGRATGTLGNPNVLAAYLAAVMPLIFTVGWPRPVALLALAVLALASLATASRGGWLAALTALTAFLYLRRSRHWPLPLALALAAVCFPWPPSERIWGALSGVDASLPTRFVIWRRSFALWLDRPLAGWGLTAPLGAAHPHNLFLEIAVSGGLLALAGYIVLGLDAAAGALRRPKSPARAAALSGVLALLVYGLGEAILTQPALAGLFWLCMGIGCKEEGVV